jgi:hypothetical protein
LTQATRSLSTRELPLASSTSKYFGPFNFFLALPPWLGAKLVPEISMYITFIRDCEVQITPIKKDLEGKHAEAENSQDSYPTIFHELLKNKDMPASEKSIDRLVQ